MATRRKDYFKHGWDALKDPQISKMVDENGMEYYGCWWALIEEISRQAWENGSNKSGVIYEKDLRNIFRKNRKCSRNVLETFRKHSLILFNFVEKFYNIEIPNLPKYLGSVGSNDSKRKSFDHIVRVKSKEIRVKSKEVVKSIEPVDEGTDKEVVEKDKSIPPKQDPPDNSDFRKKALETFYGKKYSSFPKGALTQINLGIDAWQKKTEYNDLNLYEMVLGYDSYWIEQESSGEITKYTRSKNILNFIKKEDLFKYLCDDADSAGSTQISECDLAKQDSDKFKKFVEDKKNEINKYLE